MKRASTMLRVIKGHAAPGDRLVASQTIMAGTVFFRIRGHKVVDSPNYQTVQIGVSRHAMALGTLASVNHSCHPNVLIDTKRMVCVAIRDIPAGGELNYFYPSTEWVMARPFLCLCGAPNCIRIVAGARQLSVDALSSYFLNEHIRILINHELEASVNSWISTLRLAPKTPRARRRPVRRHN
jgi:hypothetical protein